MGLVVKCSKCKKELPATVEFFHKNRQSPNGLQTSCKECRSIARKKRYVFEKKTGAIDVYYKENRLKHILRNINKRGQKQLTENELIQVLEMFKTENGSNVCPYCDREIKNTIDIHLDHFKPLSKGGDNNLNNLIPVCKYCNRSKANEFFNEWFKEQFFYNQAREDNIIRHVNNNKLKKFFIKGHKGISINNLRDLNNKIGTHKVR